MNPGKRKHSPSEGESSRSQRPKFGGSHSDTQLDTASRGAQQRHGGSALTDPSEGRFARTSVYLSTSRRAQHHRAPAPEERASHMAPHLRYILPAPSLNVTPSTNYNGSTQGWNRDLSLRSGSAIGAGQVTSTLGGRVEPTKASTLSLMSSQSNPQIATEDGLPEEDPDAVCLEDSYNMRTYCPSPSPEIPQDTRYARHKQKTLEGACSAGPSRAHAVGPTHSSTVYPYDRSLLAQPSEGHRSRYSSLADALNLSLVRYNTTPSASASPSPSSVFASTPSPPPSSTSSSPSAVPSSSLVSALSSSSSAPASSSILPSSSASSESQATPLLPDGHYRFPEIHSDVAPSVGSSDDIEASTRGDSALMDCGTLTGEEPIPQMSEGSSQQRSSSVAPSSQSPSSCELASGIQISMSGTTDNRHMNYSPTPSSGTSSSSSPPPPPEPSNTVFLSSSSIVSSFPSSQSDPSQPQRRNVVLRIPQQYDSAESIDIRSPFISSNSGASPAPAPSSSMSLPPTIPTIPTTSLLSSREPTSIPESHERVHDAALLAWLTRNLSSSAFSGLIHGSFLVLPQTIASHIQMVREAAQRHGIAPEDVDEFVVRVFSGAMELAALVDYGIRYEDLEWVIPRGTCSRCRPKE